MELRSHPRLEADEPVHVTVLGPAGSEAEFWGRLTNYSSYGIGVWVEEQLPLGTKVTVDWSAAILVGEVCYCTRRDDGFNLGLKLECPLYDTLQLAILARQLNDEEPENQNSVRPL